MRLVSYSASYGLYFADAPQKTVIRRDRGGELSLHSPANVITKRERCRISRQQAKTNWPGKGFPYVRVVEWAACRGEATSVSPPPPAAPVVTPSPSSSALAAFVAAVPQPKGPIAETVPRTTSRLAEFVAAVPSR